MFKKCLGFIVLAISLARLPFVTSQEANDQRMSEKELSVEKPQQLQEDFVETTHQVIIDGKPITYKAIAGNLLLRDERGIAKASIFFVSYTKLEEQNTQERPVTFCFNGGPGSSSVWLHLGAFGPKRVALTEYGDALPPYHLINNEFSILDVTDLVFIDPISTGYSRAFVPEDAKKFYEVKEDIKSIADFIRLYITRYNRWDSPKFIAGESYGTLRAVGLAGYMHDNQFIYVNGLLLLSSMLNFQSIHCDAGNDLPYLMFLPTYTAAAWYHKKLAPDLQANFSLALKECKDFINNEYVSALFKGNLLHENERQEIVSKLARFTGLSPDYIERSNLRVDSTHYIKELLRSQNRTIGRFDGRFTGIDSDSIGEYSEYDPSMNAIFGAFTATFNHYIHNDLKWQKDADYKILSPIASKWDYSMATNHYLNITDTLRSVMTKNSHLRVFIANGYCDLATPFFATEYTLNHLGLDPIVSNHVTMEYYPAGHMMYIHRSSLIKLKKDIARYYIETLRQQEIED